MFVFSRLVVFLLSASLLVFILNGTYRGQNPMNAVKNGTSAIKNSHQMLSTMARTISAIAIDIRTILSVNPTFLIIFNYPLDVLGFAI
jgi:hypothetical protein